MQNDFSKQFSSRFGEIVGDQSKLAVANQLGCSDVTIRYWLKGRIPYAVELLKKMRDVYGTDLNKLIAGE